MERKRCINSTFYCHGCNFTKYESKQNSIRQLKNASSMIADYAKVVNVFMHMKLANQLVYAN